ncbi:aspartate 1-decarboxylase autocleavage activator PanM [Rouxiella sp. T17]|uniref:aspartate 1-decarboxylase autocleavage activator PanM n=1 Tax=Rouxiella sp. T17 TaxID=3085684 RepID=UPI002FC9A023
MKLTIVKLETLTAQDLLDLAKIWPQQSVNSWQNWLSETQMIFAARFNDRLLAAVKVSVVDAQATLTDLCVREVTRRRGVGLYLVQDLQRLLPEVTGFSMHRNDEDAVLDAFMSACGFTLEGNDWCKEA